MTDRYRAGSVQKVINRAARFSAKVGVGPVWELTTTGHRSGEPRTVPVAPIYVDGNRYLVAAYGIVGWVQNLRASGTASLSNRSTHQSIAGTEVAAEEAGKVLAAYYRVYRAVVSQQFDLPSNPTLEDFGTVSTEHPVFRIEATDSW